MGPPEGARSNAQGALRAARFLGRECRRGEFPAAFFIGDGRRREFPAAFFTGDAAAGSSRRRSEIARGPGPSARGILARARDRWEVSWLV